MTVLSGSHRVGCGCGNFNSLGPFRVRLGIIWFGLYSRLPKGNQLTNQLEILCLLCIL